MTTSILCLGRNRDVQTTRCAVLASEGYEVYAATTPEGLSKLEGYDLVIVSARLVEEYGQDLPPGICTLVIDGFVLPIELIHSVKERLAQLRGGTNVRY